MVLMLLLAVAVLGSLDGERPKTVAPSSDRALPCDVVRPRCTEDDCYPTTPLGKPFRQPVLLRRVAPRRPAHPRRSEGVVVLEVIVSKQGAVEAPCIVRSQNPALDLEAVRAVKRWRFSPGEVDGKPSKFAIPVTVVFSRWH